MQNLNESNKKKEISMKKMYGFICMLILITICIGSVKSIAQNLYDGPESVAFDEVHNRYLVSNVRDGRVVAVDADGNQSYFHQGLGSCLGNCVDDSLFYVSTPNGINAIYLNTADPIKVKWTVILPGTNFDGMTIDSSGYLYVLETLQRRIYKINLSDQSYSLFVQSGLPEFPQDMIFDARNNLLLVCSFTANAPILAVDLADSTLSTVVTTPFGNHDGITMDNDGNVYVTCYTAGEVYRYDANFEDPPILITDDVTNPAGIDYNLRDDVLAVPNFGIDTVIFIDLSQPSLGIKSSSFQYPEGENHAVAGSTVGVSLLIQNNRQAASNVYVELLSDDAYITIINSTALVSTELGWGEEASTQTDVTLEIDSECPDPYYALIKFRIFSDGGYEKFDSTYLYIGETKGFSDDMESGEGMWMHYSGSPDFIDEWHSEDYRSVSGTYSWKVGGVGSVPYGPECDGVLLTPPLYLADNSVLTFQHRINAQRLSSTYASDGGMVFIVASDGAVEQIEPVDGYTHRFTSYPAYPVELDTPCFSGNYDWEEKQFDLSAYSGVVQIMFRFLSTNSVHLEGWYIDDVTIIGDPDYFCGDANSDTQANVGDAVYIINHVFKSGPGPVPVEAGDANCDSQCNVGDAVYLINHVFKGGPAPCEGC